MAHYTEVEKKLRNIHTCYIRLRQNDEACGTVSVCHQFDESFGIISVAGFY